MAAVRGRAVGGLRLPGLCLARAGPLAFLAWKLTTVAGFRLAARARASPAPGLLLLRVFALGARSERLFDAFGKRWLRIGNIDMIAGPDLATTAVEPHEFLDFVGGRLSRAFVRDEDDLARAMRHALGPDPDGRHRVNEFFCHDDFWRPTMLCLARAADAVLMDLRGFSPQNEGSPLRAAATARPRGAGARGGAGRARYRPRLSGKHARRAMAVESGRVP